MAHLNVQLLLLGKRQVIEAPKVEPVGRLGGPGGEGILI